MKKLTFLFLLSILPLMASAYDAEIDGICYNLNKDSKEATVTYYSSSSFYQQNIEFYKGNVTIPEKVTYNGVVYNVTAIGEHAFMTCSDMTSVVIPNSIKTIEEWAFYRCTSLTELTIPNSVTSIGELSFSWCIGLTSVTIPSSITSIAQEPFSACSGLKSISVEKGNTVYDSRNNCNAIIETASNTLIAGCNSTVVPNGVTSIGNYALCGFPDLTEITIPSSVTSMGVGVFNLSSNLTDIYYYAKDVPTINSQAFNFASLSSITLHVPAASVEAYKATAPWNEFSNIVALDDEPEVKKCAMPMIAFFGGKLIIRCQTEGVKYVCNLGFETDGNNVSLPAKVKISVYATKDGYEPSDTLSYEIDPRVLMGIIGDLNNDGIVNGIDIQEVINIIVNAE